jgi:AraC-like DNA-binding protein
MKHAPIDAFLQQGPVGRFTSTACCVVWCVSRALCGVYFWGRPSAEELLYVSRIAEAYPRWMADKFQVVVDGREVDALDGEALSVQMAWLMQHGSQLLKHAEIWSIVAEGSVVARLATAMPTLGAGEGFRITSKALEAYRAVAGVGADALSASVDASVAQVRGLPRELHVIRALLRRRLDAKIDDAAKALGMSTRSLQRWLTREDSSFHQEVVAARFALASELLLTSDLKVAAIGARLHISERAVTLLFHEQTGLTPMAWREKNKAR